MRKTIKKVDLVMWTKNGAATLPFVLKRISEVVPNELVSNRIIVDDRSTDDTREIAESLEWNVVFNRGKGISEGANTALKHVTSDCFISFEQDLLLAYDWWKKIPLHLENPEVAAASGMRFADKPASVRKLQEYVARKYRGEAKLESWLKARQMAAFTLGKTLDNTIYKTEIIRSMGGFPRIQNVGVDTLLAYKIEQFGCQWVVDYSVQSTHLRKGLKQELAHQEWYASTLNEISDEVNKMGYLPPISKYGVTFRFLISPFTGMLISWKTREPQISIVHSLIRLYYLKGLLRGSVKA